MVNRPTYSGADATDVQVTIRELQSKSNGTVTITLSAPADRYGGPLYCVVVHAFPHFTRRGKTAEHTANGQWPNRRNATFESFLYWLVFDVYTQFDALYEQSTLNL